MKTKSFNLFLVTAVMVTFSSCDMKQQLTEMHDSTGEMNDTTKKMNGTMENMDKTMKGMDGQMSGMNETMKGMDGQMKDMNGAMSKMQEVTKDMSEQTSELTDIAKIGDSSIQRRNAFEALWKATSTGRKITEAVKYLISFEYQLFSGIGQDKSEEKRARLIHEATQEFFKDINEILTKSEQPKPLAEAEKGTEENKESAFNAIAISLHKFNRKQEEYVNKFKLSKENILSMYGIISSTLKKKKDINEGLISRDELLDYEKEILINEEIAIRLLQARHNIVAVALLCELSEINKGTVVAGQNITAGKMLLSNWDVAAAKINLVQTEEYLKHIQSIYNTQNLLKEIGVAPYKDSLLSRFFKNAQWVDAKEKESAALAKARKTLKDTFLKFKENF